MPTVESVIKALWYAASLIVAVVVVDQTTPLSGALAPYMGPLHAYNRESSYTPPPPPPQPVHVSVELPRKVFESGSVTGMNWSPEMYGVPGFNTSYMSELISIKTANASGIIIKIFITANHSLPVWFSHRTTTSEDCSLPPYHHQPHLLHIPTAFDLIEYLLRFLAECIMRGNFIIRLCHMTTTLPPIAAAMLLLGLRRHLDFRGLPSAAATCSAIDMHTLTEGLQRLRRRINDLVGEAFDARQDLKISREEEKLAKGETRIAKKEARTGKEEKSTAEEEARTAKEETRVGKEETETAKEGEKAAKEAEKAAKAETRLAKEEARKSKAESKTSKEEGNRHEKEAQKSR